MDCVKQQIVLKFLFMKGLGCKIAQAELYWVLGEQASSLSRWMRQFKAGKLLCDYIFHGDETSGPGCSSL
jgi:hypothetical protein